MSVPRTGSDSALVKKRRNGGLRSLRAGFSLIEMLVVIGIVVLLSGFMVRAFRNRSTDFQDVLRQLTANIRTAQLKAIASEDINGEHPCGYGIVRDNDSSYSLYASLPSNNNKCSEHVMTGGDPIISPSPFDISASGFVFDNPFKEIFFEPPDPKVYINNQSKDGDAESIVIRRIASGVNSCNDGAAECMTVCVYTSGKVEIQNGDGKKTCPPSPPNL